MADISAPNAGAYGIWGPQYAAALAAQANSPVAGPLNMLALGSHSRREQGAYSDDLMQTQQSQLENARIEAETARMQAAAETLPAGIQYGGLDALMPFLTANGVNLDATASTARDGLVAQDVMGSVFKNRATGVTDLRGSGVGQVNEALPQTLTPSDPYAPLAPFENVTTPANAVAAQNANSNTMNAQSNRINAVRGPSSGGGERNQTVDVREEINPRTGKIERVITRRGLTPAEADALGNSNGGNSVERSGGAVPVAERERQLRAGIAAALAAAGGNR